MSTLKIALQKFINSITKKNLIEIKHLSTVELQVELSFTTFCQISYTNEEGNYCIREFTGKTWSKKLFRRLLTSTKVQILTLTRGCQADSLGKVYCSACGMCEKHA
jgi:hypothetical protein